MSDKKEKKEKIYGIIKYVAGLLGFLGILLTIFTITDVVEWYLFKIEYTGAYTEQTKLILSLTSSILGIFFLFIAFSKQIDKFFTFLENRTIKTDKSKDTRGISIESIFFLFIAIILIVLAILLGIGSLVLKTDLPLLGGATKTVLIIALVFLGILAIITAFSRVIYQSVKEMNKVHWPTGKDMIEYSKRVFSFIIFFSIFFFALDLLLANAPGWISNLFGINL